MKETTTAVLQGNGFDFAVRIYPAEEPNGSALVWLHGGGFRFGTLDMPEADQVGRRLSAEGVTVVSVDYTLAPLDAVATVASPAETEAAGSRSPFPTASIQTAVAFEWTVAHAAEWGVDPTRVALGGASAGGNLAAGAIVRLRDAGGTAPALLALVYPVLHSELPAADAELEALLEGLPEALTFPPETTRAMNAGYLAGASADDARAFPAGHDQRGLPRTLIVTAERDRLRTSGEGFAAELALAGVDVSIVKQVGALHGYLNEVGNEAAESTIRMLTAAVSSLP